MEEDSINRPNMKIQMRCQNIYIYIYMTFKTCSRKKKITQFE